MTRFLVLLLSAIKVWSSTDTNGPGDDCCYLYGSVPRNESNCVREGWQLAHSCTIYNPRDEFTNLSVRWLRNAHMTNITPEPIEAVPFIQNVSEFRRFNIKINKNRNCTHGTLYEDTFSLYIHNFTSDKNGYYWCQIVVNGSFLEPSQHYAWFYADNSSSCEQQLYFQMADEAQCANISGMPLSPSVMLSDPGIITPSTPSPATITTIAVTHNDMILTTVAMDSTKPNEEPIFYTVGVLSILAFLLGTFVFIMLLVIIRKIKTKHKQRNGELRLDGETAVVNIDREVAHLSVSNTPLHERDSTISGEDCDIHSTVSDTSLGIITTRHTDTQQDHTYDAAEFHSQIHSNELPEYNTLQHGKAAKIQIDSNTVLDTYDKIDFNTGKDHQKCSKLTKQLQRNTHTTDANKYDDVAIDRTDEMMPGDYEPVYHEPNYTQVNNSTGKYMFFDDERYGTHKPVSKRVGMNGIAESMSHSESTTAVKEEISTANNEVEYPEPLPSNATSHAQTKSEHFYHSLEHSNAPMKPKKCVSGVSFSNESSDLVVEDSTIAFDNDRKLALKDQVTAYAKYQTPTFASLYDGTHARDEVGITLNAPILFNLDQYQFDDPMYEGIPHSVPKQADKNPPLSLDLFHEKMQTKHNDYASSTEEDSCTGDLNDDPELINHEEAPEYGDPIISEHLDDNNMATDQRDQKVNIYDTFDDLA